MKEINPRKKTGFQNLSLYVVLVIFILSMGSCFTEFPIEPFYDGEDETISDYIDAHPETFSDFENALLNSDLLPALSARNPNGNLYTLFLPTNEAFDHFVENSSKYSSIDELLSDKSYIRSLVKYHIVNSGYQTNDFPFGALPDTTISGQILNVGFSGNWDSTIYKINNRASVIQPNIELANGYIHVIDEVLTPVVLNSYEWLRQSSKFTIFTQALEKTGLKDTFAIHNGSIANTVLAEPDEVYNKKGIYTIDDLIGLISPDDSRYTSHLNNLFQFVSYHILEGDLFLNDFEGVNSNFNTYAIFPMLINGEGLNIIINPGSGVFDTIVTGTDTTIVSSIGIDYEESNNLTMNGAVHQIDQVLRLYRPKPSTRAFRFYEENTIKEASNITREYVFNENDKYKFNYLSWSGVEELMYVKTSNSDANNDDYLELNGDFEISYVIPKILPGEYNLQIRAQTVSSDNATVWVFLDGKRIGGNLDLTIGPDKWGHGFNWMDVGTVSLEEYKTYTITVKSLISGTFYWDEIRFQY